MDSYFIGVSKRLCGYLALLWWGLVLLMLVICIGSSDLLPILSFPIYLFFAVTYTFYWNEKDR